ncbi:transmembrane protein, putative (macronuclear) [Tetrahymena thermophila SB210]|uniref:Transmembrane protein, putative n=1 Tax=Tetrahymena thermophila (strain SB210) TaxID=312017 RepID=I7M0K9_TETTS|nr:transmembrane protein, putative [Tetrahymena thermophila SB210]EAR89310.2 transmembrane protein, putative [Tetrahymena thermophila SB210]|eukprot:XP_001009555.2 transmembrane protein, putative [Tetrahymena thermophila SB210]
MWRYQTELKIISPKNLMYLLIILVYGFQKKIDIDERNINVPFNAQTKIGQLYKNKIIAKFTSLSQLILQIKNIFILVIQLYFFQSLENNNHTYAIPKSIKKADYFKITIGIFTIKLSTNPNLQKFPQLGYCESYTSSKLLKKSGGTTVLSNKKPAIGCNVLSRQNTI